MLFSLGLVFLAAGAIAAPTDERIVNGTEVKIEQFPYQLSLQSGIIHICGASIISPTRALTAAHCIHTADVNRLKVRAHTTVKETGGTVHEVEAIIEHPDYKPLTQLNDVAVLKLKTPIKLDESAKIIPLAEKSYEVQPNSKAVVTGWGRQSENGSGTDILNMLEIPMADRKDCKKIYQYFGDSMICGGYIEGGRDSCKGDSGGPLVQNGKQIGVVSFGSGCARPGQLGYYANVAKLRDFIDSNM